MFYDLSRSGGLGAAIGCARATYSDVRSVDAISAQFEAQGVLSKEELDEMAHNGTVHVIVFDQFQAFQRPVPIERMRQLGADSPTSLVSAEVFSSDVIEQICRAGFTSA